MTTRRAWPYAVLLWVSLTGALAAEVALPTANAVPGGVAIVQLNLASEPKPEVNFADKRVMVVARGQHWFAVVGIPLDVVPGQYNLIAKQQDDIVEYPVRVQAKDYPVQHLVVRNKNHVEPDPAELARIASERERLGAAFASWTPNDAPELRFDMPAQGRLSSQFGLRRFFNNQPRQPHGGLDIAAPIGTRVNAPARGSVVATGDFFFNGNTVLIDHGQGLVSMYCHLSKIDVMPGQELKRGEKIGEVGNSGRATGPHLHWTVSLNKSAVDPHLFLAPARAKP